MLFIIWMFAVYWSHLICDLISDEKKNTTSQMYRAVCIRFSKSKKNDCDRNGFISKMI